MLTSIATLDNTEGRSDEKKISLIIAKAQDGTNASIDNIGRATQNMGSTISDFFTSIGKSTGQSNEVLSSDSQPQ